MGAKIMPDLYDRQRGIALHRVPSITVVGAGGVGFWVASLAAMSGVTNIFLFDPDVLEETNRNRLPVCESSINRPKVEVLADHIKTLRPEAVVVPVIDRLEGVLLDVQLRICGTYIDCTDSPKTQYDLYTKCKDRGFTYIRAGYDGTHITVTSNVSGWIRLDVEEEHYQVNPSWVVPAVTVAALAVGKLLKYHEQEVGLDMSEIGVPVVQRQRRLTQRCRRR